MAYSDQSFLSTNHYDSSCHENRLNTAIFSLIHDIVAQGGELICDGGKLAVVLPEHCTLQPEQQQLLSAQKSQVIAIWQTIDKPSDGYSLSLKPADANKSEHKPEWFPLSPSQQRMWNMVKTGRFGDLTLTAALSVTGSVDLDLLQEALVQLVKDHSILRTRYSDLNDERPDVDHSVNDQPVNDKKSRQQVLPVDECHSLKYLTCINIPDDDLLAGVIREIHARQLTRLDISSGEAIHLYWFSNQLENVLLLVVHHIAADGLSLQLIWQQLQQHYLQLLNPSNHQEIAAPSLQYRDYACAIADWNNTDGGIAERRKAEEYWKKAISLDYGYRELPCIGAASDADLSSKTIEHLLTTAELTRLRQVAADQHVTLTALLLSCLYQVLYPHTIQTHETPSDNLDKPVVGGLNIGMPVTGRNRREINQLIGFFANTLVISIEHVQASSTPVEQILFRATQIHQTLTQHFEHQTFPFQSLMNLLTPPSDNRVFQVSFNHTSQTQLSWRLPDSDATLLDNDALFGQKPLFFDLRVNVTERPVETTKYAEEHHMALA